MAGSKAKRRAHKRGLARAIGADQTDAFAGFDRQADTIHHRTAVAPDGQGIEGKQASCHFLPRLVDQVQEQGRADQGGDDAQFQVPVRQDQAHRR